jgi:hypothetical protein
MAVPVLGEELVIDFNTYPLDKAPAGFQSVLGGGGKPADWRVITESAAAPGSTNINGPTKVLAQLSQDGADEHFPMLVFDQQSFGDFTLSTRFKIVDGLFEQMAGIAFRWQDTNNYYYVRASALGKGSFRFFKVVNGQRALPIGPDMEVAKDVWHELKIDAKGNHMSFLLDGQQPIPPLTDNSFSAGRIAFWTKSDSVAHFGRTVVSFEPHETLAQILIREALKRYPRVGGLRIYAQRGDTPMPKVIASNNADEVGLEGGKVEQDVIARDVLYYGKQKGIALVTLPLHDRNGEVAAAVRLVLESFPGQTEQNAVARAQPIVKLMEQRVRNAKELTQ